MNKKRRSNRIRRPQASKNKSAAGQSFTMFRPVAAESAEELYELAVSMKCDGILPADSEVRPPGDMRVTYIERRRLTRELQGYVRGFNAYEAISRINYACESQPHSIVAAIGRTSLMDRRDDTLVARLDHNQIVAEEYKIIFDALRGLYVPIKDSEFKPHISLVHIPNQSKESKLQISREIQTVLPEEVTLEPLTTHPFSRQ